MRFAPAIVLLLASASCLAQTTGYRAPTSQTNNPVSMVFEHKQTQTLADGTNINIVSHEYFYRDSLGRTRTETEFVTPFFGQSQPARNVSVRDPVAKTFTTWQTGGTSPFVPTFRRNDELTPPHPVLAAPANGSQSRTGLPVRTPQLVATPGPKTTTEQLGTLDMQGVPCEASRTTVVYPVGFMGNDRPVTTVAQRCQAREFGRELLDFTEDPRTGTRSMALQSIRRGEPDPSLFLPPPNYIDAKSQAH